MTIAESVDELDGVKVAFDGTSFAAKVITPNCAGFQLHDALKVTLWIDRQPGMGLPLA
jgi:hypothetical protein